MTKLTMMDLGPRNTPMWYCERCKEWVPQEIKHKRKRHNTINGGKKQWK